MGRVLALSFDFDHELEPNAVEENIAVLGILKRWDVSSVLLVAGRVLSTQEGRAIVEDWASAGHVIGNHSFAHHNYADPLMTVEDFREELNRNHELICMYPTFRPWFRFPFLKEGESRLKLEGARAVLGERVCQRQS